MENIINSLSKQISPDIVRHASSSLGESDGGITKALDGAFPTILGGLLNRSSDSVFMGNVLRMSNELAEEGPINSNILKTERGQPGGLVDKGRSLLSSLFGSKTNDIAGSISQTSGVKPTSALSLLTLAGPIVLGFLGKKARAEGMNAEGLTNFLGHQKNNIINAMPVGVRNLLGVEKREEAHLYTSERDRATLHRDPVERGPIEEEHHHRRSNWKSVVFGLLGLLILFFVGRGFAKHIKHKREVRKHNEMVMRKNEAARFDTTISSTRGKVVLPNGVAINIPQNSAENRLLMIVRDKSRPVNKNARITVDRVTFRPSSTALESTSQEQLRNVAAIMKAYPNTAIKLVSHTDNEGNRTEKVKLSEQRANVVKTTLVNMGANSNSIKAEGENEKDHAAHSGQANNKVDFIVLKR